MIVKWNDKDGKALEISAVIEDYYSGKAYGISCPKYGVYGIGQNVIEAVDNLVKKINQKLESEKEETQ